MVFCMVLEPPEEKLEQRRVEGIVSGCLYLLNYEIILKTFSVSLFPLMVTKNNNSNTKT